MKYIYGPIKSRRLGLSLGLSLSKDKVCNFDCIYCQWGSVGKTFSKRKGYAKVENIILELKSWMRKYPRQNKDLAFVTLSGLGEPTLNTHIGELIDRIKEITPAKIAVITNSALLGNADVRKQLLKADLIVPSLDAVDPEIFKEIDRPDSAINLDDIIRGLISLSQEFKGKIWLEIMFVAGVNDDLKHVQALKKVIQRINPDKIQLNSPVRTTAEKNVLVVKRSKLESIGKILGNKAEII